MVCQCLIAKMKMNELLCHRFSKRTFCISVCRCQSTKCKATTITNIKNKRNEKKNKKNKYNAVLCACLPCFSVYESGFRVPRFNNQDPRPTGIVVNNNNKNGSKENKKKKNYIYNRYLANVINVLLSSNLSLYAW